VRERLVMTNTCLGWLRPVLALVALVTSSGCSELNNCAEGSDVPIIVEGGTTDPENLVYVSAPWEALTKFPPKRMLRFEHNLGVTPWLVLPYLSFAEHGTNGSGGGSVTLASGNATLVECADSRVIVLRNDTCEEDFYVRVVAEALPDGETKETCGE
jgi:hypothetical protein